MNPVTDQRTNRQGINPSSGGNQQPGYSTAHGQHANVSQQQPGYHPVEGIKQAVHEHNPMSSDQPRGPLGVREGNTFPNERQGHSTAHGGSTFANEQPGYSTTQGQGQYADRTQQPAMRDHPVENIKQTMHEHNPMNTNTQHGQQYSAMQGGNTNTNTYGDQQPLHHSGATTTPQGQQNLESGVHPSYSPMQTHPQPTVTKPVLEGHVFARMQLFAALPESLRNDARQFQAYVEKDKSRLFDANKHSLMKSVYSIRGRELIDSIITWLHGRYAARGQSQGQGQTQGQIQGQSQTSAPVSATGTATGQQGVGFHTPMSATNTTPSSTVSNASDRSHASTGRSTTAYNSMAAPGTAELVECAKLVAEALVLSGFLTPDTDDFKHLHTVAPEHFVHDDELLVPVAKSVTEFETTSVWSVADGAIYARALKRKAGMLGKLMGGKEVYLVINEKTKKAYLFASDLSREPIDEFRGDMTKVSIDNSHFDYGVRVKGMSSGVEKMKPEIFDAGSKAKQEELITMWRSIGAVYREHNVKKLIDAKTHNVAGGKHVTHGEHGKPIDAKTHNVVDSKHAVRGDRTENPNIANKPHENRMADVATAGMSGLAPPSRAQESVPQTTSMQTTPHASSKHHHQQQGHTHLGEEPAGYAP